MEKIFINILDALLARMQPEGLLILILLCVLLVALFFRFVLKKKPKDIRVDHIVLNKWTDGYGDEQGEALPEDERQP